MSARTSEAFLLAALVWHSAVVAAQGPPPMGLVPAFGARGALSGTVMSIDRTRAQIVVSRGNDAAYMVLQVPRDVVGFNTIREGSTVRGRFEEIVVLRLEPRAQRTAVGGKRAEPVTLTRTMAGIITKVDVKAPSVTFTGPNGWSYSWPVINRAVLEGVKVGDEVDVTFASGVLTSIECFIRCRESK